MTGAAEALAEWLSGYDGWSEIEAARRCDPATIARIKQTRALLAKQYMNGVRLVINARRSLEDNARPAALPSIEVSDDA